MANATPRGRADATRAQILDTALAVFAQTGYRGASIRDIASKSGISHPTLLYHFPSKAALLMAVLEWRDHVDCDDIDDEGIDFDDLPGRPMLAHLVRSAVHNAGQRGIVELFAQLSAESSAPEHPAHAYFSDRYAVLRQTVTRGLTELAADGQLREGLDPLDAASSIIAIMDGLQVQWLLDERVDMAKTFLAYLNAGVLHPDHQLQMPRVSARPAALSPTPA